MKQSKFPAGWDEKRVREVLAHYESQTEAEAVGRIRLQRPDQSSHPRRAPLRPLDVLSSQLDGIPGDLKGRLDQILTKLGHTTPDSRSKFFRLVDEFGRSGAGRETRRCADGNERDADSDQGKALDRVGERSFRGQSGFSAVARAARIRAMQSTAFGTSPVARASSSAWTF